MRNTRNTRNARICLVGLRSGIIGYVNVHLPLLLLWLVGVVLSNYSKMF